MNIPPADVEVPARVRALARGAGLVPVWRNDYGGLTFRTDDGRYVKHGPRNAESSFAGEAERLGWAAGHITVPRVLEAGADDTHEWMVTAAVPGRSAVDPAWRAHPAVAVRAVGEGLRALHDALPVEDCPFDWGVPRASRMPKDAASVSPTRCASRRPSTAWSCATATPAAPTR